MFYIGISDIICMFFNGILTGYMAIRGTVFCSNPRGIYIAGCIALGVSFNLILVVFNRYVYF